MNRHMAATEKRYAMDSQEENGSDVWRGIAEEEERVERTPNHAQD